MNLTEDQKRQIEANRQAALAKLAARHATNPAALPPTTLHPNHSSASSLIGTKRPASLNQAQPKPLVMHDKQDDPKKPVASANAKPKVDYSPLIDVFSIQLNSPTTFACRHYRQLAEYYRSYPGYRYCEDDKTWSFSLSHYENFGIFHITTNLSIHCYFYLCCIVQRLPFRPKSNSLIPKHILAIFASHPNRSHDLTRPIEYDRLDRILYDTLLPFQKEGIEQALRWNGRMILADDMGLGKSLQALGIISYYRTEWPVLIVAPSSMVASWHEQILKWIPSIPFEQINVIYDGKACLNGGLINVISFDLLVRMATNCKLDRTFYSHDAIHIYCLLPWVERKFRVIVVDESHALKNSTSKRSQIIVPICKAADRVILLSGTPALSRPVELYPQIEAVAPKLFPNFFEFGQRYCGGKQGPFGWDWRGASHLCELQIILEKTILLRRVKEQVLTQLPRKIRQQIFLKLSGTTLKLLEKQRKAVEALPTNQPFDYDESALQPGVELMDLWRRTAEAKLEFMLEYLKDLLESVPKILLFAHHQNIIEAFCSFLSAHSHGYIRIDGRTPTSERQNLCTEFQTKEELRVAVLSITAASTGITLTAANTVVFAELFWNPGVLVQAEDRAHRIGQTDSVVVHYLLAKGTSDDTIWPLILRKLNTLESVGLGKNDFSSLTQVQHDKDQLRLDKWSSQKERLIEKDE